MGPKVARELESWEVTQAAIENGTAGSEGVQAFVDEGRWAYTNLQALVHGEPVDARFSARKVSKWLRFSRRSRKDFGLKVLHDAIEPPEWARATSHGDS